jgi:hypothetical protein
VQPAFYVDLRHKAVWHPRRFVIGWSIASVARRARGATLARPRSAPRLHDVGFANPACSVAPFACEFIRARHFALAASTDLAISEVRKKVTKLEPWNIFFPGNCGICVTAFILESTIVRAELDGLAVSRPNEECFEIRSER